MKEQTKLKLGTMSIEEMAEWRGVNINTYKKNYAKNFKPELQTYCIFDEVREGSAHKLTGFIINKIHNSFIYIPPRSKNYQEIKEYYFDWLLAHQNTIYTYTLLANNYLDNTPSPCLSFNTIVNYLGRAGMELHGAPLKINKNTLLFADDKGEVKPFICRAVQAKSIDGAPVALSKAEIEKKKELFLEIVINGKSEVSGEVLDKILNEVEDGGNVKESVEKYYKVDYEERYRVFREKALEVFGGYLVTAKESEVREGKFMEEWKES